ncbi:hypothetical protein N2152v2_005861 [Parachlorella kessleri]
MVFHDWSHLSPDVLCQAATFVTSTADRHSAQTTCHSWHAALHKYWSRACFLARHPDAELPMLLLQNKWTAGQDLWPQLRQLDVAELDAQRLAWTLRQLVHASFPSLTSLCLSTTLHEPCSDQGQMSELHLPQLQDLRLDDVLLTRGLSSVTHLAKLTALHVCVTHHGHGASQEPWLTRCLAELPYLQALSLPALGQHARQDLSLLTSLTRLSFGAAGSGAIGASLLPLKDSLVSLRVSLHHVRDHFLVLHPAVEWGCLAQLHRLTSLQVLNWAAGRHNAAPLLSAPLYVWADQTAAEQHAQVLLDGLPQLHSLRLTAAYCRLDRAVPQPGGSDERGGAALAQASLPVGPGLSRLDGMDSGQGHSTGEVEGRAVVGDGRGRWWVRQEQRIPVQTPGSRRGEEWYDAWWQDDVQEALQDLYGPDDPALLRYRADAHDMAGWVAIRPGKPETFNVELGYELLGK